MCLGGGCLDRFVVLCWLCDVCWLCVVAGHVRSVFNVLYCVGWGGTLLHVIYLSVVFDHLLSAYWHARAVVVLCCAVLCCAVLG